jgi:Restriction endonuclease
VPEIGVAGTPETMTEHPAGDAIDLIYNEFVADAKRKHGTKYEIVAAIVFKALLAEHKVVHDLRLSGPGKRTKHQIDVTVERRDGPRLRLIIECRHLFPTSRRPRITLPAVRDFASVVRDLEPAQGMMLTTIGYTSDARTYAEEQRIALGILRAARDEDTEGLVEEVRIRANYSAPPPPMLTWIARDDAERERVRPLLEARAGEPESRWSAVTYLYDEKGNPTETLHEVLDPIFKRIDREPPDADSGREMFDRVRWLDIRGVRVAVVGFDWEDSGDDTEFSEEYVISLGERVAKLVLQTLDGALDFVIFDRDLMAFEVGVGGEIVPRRD